MIWSRVIWFVGLMKAVSIFSSAAYGNLGTEKCIPNPSPKVDGNVLRVGTL